MTSTFGGAVLCGGSSRRMGRDKATLRVHGEAMAVRVANALHDAGAVDVIAVGGDARALEDLGLQVVPDDEPGAGPFPATLTALRRLSTDIVVVLSCDLVAPSSTTIGALVERLRSCGPEVHAAVPVVDGNPQWTHAAWRQEALGALVEARGAGVRSLRRAADRLVIDLVQGVPAADVADADDPLDLPGAR